ncbi:MAG: hypothetical protein IKY01_10385 [Prevotella sp.]|nr:hypothetical protein [Prevotella sp.]
MLIRKFIIAFVFLFAAIVGVNAQSMEAYSAYKFFGINAEDTTSFPTFLILPAEYAHSRELLELERRAEPNIIENTTIYNAGAKRMEENLKKAKASGEMDPETIKMLEEEIAEIRGMGAEAETSDFRVSQDKLNSMREEVFSHALFKKYFWAAETMYGNIIAIQDRKMPEAYNNTHKVWGIINDKGEMVIPCNIYRQGEEFSWWNEKIDVILLRDLQIKLFRSDGSRVNQNDYPEAHFVEASDYTAVAVMLDVIDPQTGFHLWGLVDGKTGREIQKYNYEDIRSDGNVVIGWRNHDGKKYIIDKDGREIGEYLNRQATYYK